MKQILIIILLLLLNIASFAQLNPMGSVYYQNQYLNNPAMAGIAEGWELNAAYKATWANINNAPKMQALTANYGSSNHKTGFGLIFYNEKAGVVRTTSAKASYAYHLYFNDKGAAIDFGLSVGMLNEYINRAEIIGDQDDGLIADFNERKLYLDADFGIAIRAYNFTLQGAMPNLKRFFKRDLQRNIVDRSLFMIALSYLHQQNGVEFEPKLVFRAVENYKNLLDAGLNIGFSDNRLMLSGIYHTSGSLTFGVGTTHKKQFAIIGQYTTNTKVLQQYGNGEAEIALRYSFK